MPFYSYLCDFHLHHWVHTVSPESDILSSIRILLDKQLEKTDERFSIFEMKLNDRVNKFENKFTEPKDAVEFQGTEIKSFREKVSSLKVSLGKEKS